MSRTVSITCPHCASTLKVDVDAGVVVEHAAPKHAKEKIDFESRLKALESDKQRASDRMAEAMRKEQNKGRILEDRFRELMDKAKDDDGTKPVRDIDLD